MLELLPSFVDELEKLSQEPWRAPGTIEIIGGGKWRKPGSPEIIGGGPWRGGGNIIKTAFHAATPGMKAFVKMRNHFDAPKKDWDSFENDLRSATFRKAVLAAREADPKLKKYVKTFGGYLASNDVIAKIKSKDSGRTYKVKDLHTGRWGCNCRDWQYIHSVKGGNCKHIKSVKESKLVKEANPFGLAFTSTNRSMRHRDEGKKAKANLHRLYGGPPPKDSLLRSMIPGM